MNVSVLELRLWVARPDFRPKAANPFSYTIGLVTALLLKTDYRL